MSTEQHTQTPQAEQTEQPQLGEAGRISIANALLGDWNAAMDRFFEAAERERERRGITDEAMAVVLDSGYGDEIADAWREWTQR